MRHILWRAAAAAGLLACAAPAAAQRGETFPTIRVGQTVNGTLSQSDPKMGGRGPFRVYRFDAREGQRLVVTMRSTAFDAYLTLARSVGGITDEVEVNDDHGGNTDARIRFTAPESGSYLLVAQSLPADGAGAYTLSLAAAPVPTTAEANEIRIGEMATGTLAESDQIDDEDDTFYDTWSYRGRAGQRLVVEMQSSAFDTHLSFGRMEGGELSVLASNDDVGEGNTNSRLRVRLPADGEYVVRASSLGAEQTGAYTLHVLERTGQPAPPRAIEAGQTVQGELSDEDDVMEDNSFYDYWIYTARAGERLRITMSSEAFDTFLAIGRLDGESFEEVASNDDGPDGTNSQIEVTLPQAGRYHIRANSLNGGNTGAYTLRVETIR